MTIPLIATERRPEIGAVRSRGALRISASVNDSWARHHHIYGLIHGIENRQEQAKYELEMAHTREPALIEGLAAALVKRSVGLSHETCFLSMLESHCGFTKPEVDEKRCATEQGTLGLPTVWQEPLVQVSVERK